MKIKELNKKNTPNVAVDSTLDKYRNHPAFQSKVDKAKGLTITLSN
ncbi:hypothetical protein Phep_1749 [Pedobacter heparinus DSM 2366]|uniref:Uncharacterized protein n=1 Tax=Pedobacter heparinus (strain ATCC 13125 / DSM 2366 / CIP 104194 / JCM 7457 / NBRC 12017 / NCIMB 9290 / NRRL B-14731 / HIM 762-3) TaxID=485917 RepID=C6XV92_PEDHD|nr:hypothetical protein Phep_1749 [Pedobacter heparinus DSM 2366]